MDATATAVKKQTRMENISSRLAGSISSLESSLNRLNQHLSSLIGEPPPPASPIAETVEPAGRFSALSSQLDQLSTLVDQLTATCTDYEDI